MIIDTISLFFTVLFLFVVISYYIFALLPARRYRSYRGSERIAILIPARNEARVIARAIEAVIDARWNGEKDIIVIDDGSDDATSEVARRYPVVVLRNDRHRGKSRSLNRALDHTEARLICVVDADSTVRPDALENLVEPLGDMRVGAVTSTIGVVNRSMLPNPFVHIELLYNSLIRSILSKLNGNVVTPGPLSCYRRDALESVGYFPTDVYSEDVDLTVRIIRAGYLVAVAERARVDTVMPTIPREFKRQRMRFSRGVIFIFRRHLSISRRFIDFYTIPLLLFTYLQSTIMGSITVIKIVQGITLFSPSDVVGIARFLFDWLTMNGFIRWAGAIASGAEPLTAFAVFGLLSSALTYPLYALAIARYDRFHIRDVLAIFFLPIFWLVLSIFYLIAATEFFTRSQENRWKKNER